MRDFGFDFGPVPDPDAVARTNRFLDALAARESVAVQDPGDEALAVLLESWRDESRWPPATGLVSEYQAAAALRSGAASRRRPHRGLTVVGSVAATVLTLGGLGAVVAGAHPGDALYGLRTVLLGEYPSVYDDQIVLAARTELDNVQQMIAIGQWDRAQDKLATVGDTVQTVNDAGRKQELIDQWNQLNAKVQKRDANATRPPGSAPSPAPDDPEQTTATPQPTAGQPVHGGNAD